MAKRKPKKSTKARTKRRKRARLKPGGVYFDETVERFPSGCTLLDCVLGGGWPEGRVSNIVGDKSTGKTLLAIEACANFHQSHPKRPIYYVETEAAFDPAYAEYIGLPIKAVTFPEDIFTVEDLYESIRGHLNKDRPLWIVDSLDALHLRADAEVDLDKGSFGAEKAKLMSRMFRDLNQKLSRSGATLLIISQVRARIGVAFGRQTTRYGGKALDFYASLVVWLAHVGRIERERRKVKRVIGVDVRAKCEKSKVGVPFRECDFPVYFNFGIEDVEAGLTWLIKAKRWDLLGLRTKDETTKLRGRTAKMESEEYDELRARVSVAVREAWESVEQDFRPNRRKYGP